MMRKTKGDRRISDTIIDNDFDLKRNTSTIDEEEVPRLPKGHDKSVSVASIKHSTLSVTSSCIIRHPKNRSTSPSPSPQLPTIHLSATDDDIAPPATDPIATLSPREPPEKLGVAMPHIRRLPSSDVSPKAGPTTPRKEKQQSLPTTPLQIKAKAEELRHGERTARRLNKAESQSIRTQLSVMSLADLKEHQDRVVVDRSADTGFVRNPHKKRTENVEKAREIAKVEDDDSRMELSLDSLTQLRVLGRGTYGIIKLVRHKKPPHGLYALKTLDKRQQIQENEVEHVMSESKLLKALDFPFIVKHYASFQDDARLYILMEYVTGSDLFTYIQEYRFDNELVRFFASQVVMLLEYLHLQDVVFRDLKPENLLIDWRGYLKLTDFSFAKTIVDKTNTFCGTPCYMAPEIILQEGHGKSVDWWSLGILIYEMFTGHPPFDKHDAVELYEEILTAKPIFDERFGEAAIDLVSGLLNKDPDQRLGSRGAQEVKDHPFFDEIDWDSIYTRRVKSPLPSHVIDNPVKLGLDMNFGNPLPLTVEEQKYFIGF